MKSKFVKLSAAVLLAGLVPLAPAAPVLAESTQVRAATHPAAFFTGKTVSRGTLKEVLSPSKATHTVNIGTMQANGELVIDQEVTIGDDPVMERVWRLRELGNGKVTGTISDATSPIKGKITGNVMTLSYKLKGGLNVSQVLTVAEDGKTAANSLKIRKFGIVVARLTETITRQTR